MHFIFRSKMTHKICGLKINTINKIFNNIISSPKRPEGYKEQWNKHKYKFWKLKQ